MLSSGYFPTPDSIAPCSFGCCENGGVSTVDGMNDIFQKILGSESFEELPASDFQTDLAHPDDIFVGDYAPTTIAPNIAALYASPQNTSTQPLKKARATSNTDSAQTDCAPKPKDLVNTLLEFLQRNCTLESALNALGFFYRNKSRESLCKVQRIDLRPETLQKINDALTQSDPPLS